VDEAAQPGGATPAENGNGAGPRGDRARHNGGWAALDAGWSQAGAALEPGFDPAAPSWRAVVNDGATRGWTDPTSRYADLLGPADPEASAAGPRPSISPPVSGVTASASASVPAPAPEAVPAAPVSAPTVPVSGPSAPVSAPTAPVSAPTAPTAPVSAPAALARPGSPTSGGPVAADGFAEASGPAGQAGWRPEHRPDPGGRSALWDERDAPAQEGSSRRAGRIGSTPGEGVPIVHPPHWEQAPAPPATTGTRRYPEAAPPGRPGTAPWGYPNAAQRGYAEPPPAGYAERPPAGYAEPPPGYAERPPAGYAEPSPGQSEPPAGYAEPASGYAVPPGFRPHRPDDDPYLGGPAHATSPPAGGSTPPVTPAAPDEQSAATLPQRIPAEPDVPAVPEPLGPEPPAEAPELARIATHLRRYDVPPQRRELPPGFDVPAILAAVRGVPGVRDASLRANTGAGHTLRLELADGADPAQVSRTVARLLQERMGLAAEPRGDAWRSEEPHPPSGHPSPPRQARPEEAGGHTRRWQPPATARGRATPPRAGGPAAYPEPVGQAEQAPRPGPLNPRGRPGPRVVIDHVQVGTVGLDANVEVRLIAGGEHAVGVAGGPATETYILRLCAVAAASAIDEMLRHADPSGQVGRCFLEHATVVPLGGCDVAVVVVLLACGEGGWVEQLAGSAVVDGDQRQAVVRATLAAVNRRLEALLAGVAAGPPVSRG
jgi:hypothetical protein